MDVVDDRGYVFGVVNVIDLLLAVFLTTAVLVGAVFAFTPVPQQEKTQKISVESTPIPTFAAESIETGPVPNDEINRVTNVTVVQRDGNMSQVIVRLVVVVGESPDGLPMFESHRLYIGRKIFVDLGRVAFRGRVTDMEPIQG